MLVFREICIRCKLSTPLQKQLEAYKRINEALVVYLAQLKQLDIAKFKEETEQYNKLIRLMDKANSEEELNVLLITECKALGIQLPYEGDFDKDFMQDESAVLIFK